MYITPKEWKELRSMVADMHVMMLGNGNPEDSFKTRLCVIEKKMRNLLWLFGSCLVVGFGVILGKALS